MGGRPGALVAAATSSCGARVRPWVSGRARAWGLVRRASCRRCGWQSEEVLEEGFVLVYQARVPRPPRGWCATLL